MARSCCGKRSQAGLLSFCTAFWERVACGPCYRLTGDRVSGSEGRARSERGGWGPTVRAETAGGSREGGRFDINQCDAMRGCVPVLSAYTPFRTRSLGLSRSCEKAEQICKPL